MWSACRDTCSRNIRMTPRGSLISFTSSANSESISTSRNSTSATTPFPMTPLPAMPWSPERQRIFSPMFCKTPQSRPSSPGSLPTTIHSIQISRRRRIPPQCDCRVHYHTTRTCRRNRSGTQCSARSQAPARHDLAPEGLVRADDPQLKQRPRIEQSERHRIDSGTTRDVEGKAREIRGLRQFVKNHHHQNRRASGTQEMRHRQRQAEFRKSDNKTAGGGRTGRRHCRRRSTDQSPTLKEYHAQHHGDARIDRRHHNHQSCPVMQQKHLIAEMSAKVPDCSRPC